MIGTAAALALAAATVGSAAIGANASKNAANAQVNAADKAAQLQADQFAQQRADQEPFRQAGLTTQNELLRQFGLGGDAASAGYGNLMRNFGQQDFQADPGYGFRLSEGLKSVDRQAAARGGLISGGALKAAERYGQNLASDEYQNAFNRYNQNRQLNYNMLSGQQAVGQGATNAVGAAGQNYANTAGEAYMGAGNARASGYVGAANAIGQGVGGLTNMYMQNQVLNRLAPSSGASSTYGLYSSPNTTMTGDGTYLSDRRFKRNIEHIATRLDGLKVYLFEYIFSPIKHIGFMAQEVRELYPDAVVERDDGVLLVNYGKVQPCL
jgi:hypothetical protein